MHNEILLMEHDKLKNRRSEPVFKVFKNRTVLNLLSIIWLIGNILYYYIAKYVSHIKLNIKSRGVRMQNRNLHTNFLPVQDFPNQVCFLYTLSHDIVIYLCSHTIVNHGWGPHCCDAVILHSLHSYTRTSAIFKYHETKWYFRWNTCMK